MTVILLIIFFNLKTDRSLPFPHNTIETAIRATRIIQNGFTCQLVAFGRPTAVQVTTFLFLFNIILKTIINLITDSSI